MSQREVQAINEDITAKFDDNEVARKLRATERAKLPRFRSEEQAELQEALEACEGLVNISGMPLELKNGKFDFPAVDLPTANRGPFPLARAYVEAMRDTKFIEHITNGTSGRMLNHPVANSQRYW